jgi:hypothetical protein
MAVYGVSLAWQGRQTLTAPAYQRAGSNRDQPDDGISRRADPSSAIGPVWWPNSPSCQICLTETCLKKSNGAENCSTLEQRLDKQSPSTKRLRAEGERFALAGPLGGNVVQRKPTMTTIVLAHPDDRCPRFQVFGIYDGPDDRFVFAVHKFDEQERAEQVARKIMEKYGADHFERVVRKGEPGK